MPKHVSEEGNVGVCPLNQPKGENMLKKVTLSLCAVLALGSVAFAGTSSYSGKEMKNTVQQQTCPEWYANTEWNVGIWGTYSFTGTEWREDRYLGVDHAWGGGLDAKNNFGMVRSGINFAF